MATLSLAIAQHLPAVRARWDALTRLVLGPPPPAQLPERARKAIRASEDASEVVVGWIQVGAILTFALFYAVSEKDFAPSIAIPPVPAALAAYALFTAFRLFLAYRRKLGPRFLAASVVIDMTVLMLTIWSFPLQYQAPPGIYLKAPTLLYVFILIGLRALRFDPRYVVLAGATALFGWSVLVAFVGLSTPGGMEITHSYTEYMTSYKLLVGAEIDKLIAIGMVTAILSVVVLRARRMLIRMAAGESAAEELSRFVGKDVAQRIRSADLAFHAGEGRIRKAAILFVDLRGFTRASHNLGPHEVISLLGDYQARIVPVIEAAGGHVDKFLGDGILASFGAVRLSATYAIDAWRAAEHVLAVSRKWCREREEKGLPRLSVAVALTAGEVVSGAVGYLDRLEFTVIGDPVNLAAKLEKHTKSAMVDGIATREAFELARFQGEDTPKALATLGGVQVDGVAFPLDLVVIGEGDTAFS